MKILSVDWLYDLKNKSADYAIVGNFFAATNFFGNFFFNFFHFSFEVDHAKGVGAGVARVEDEAERDDADADADARAANNVSTDSYEVKKMLKSCYFASWWKPVCLFKNGKEAEGATRKVLLSVRLILDLS